MGETFNELLDTAGRVGRAAVQTTSSLVNKGMDKAQVMALKNRVAKMHRQLGALVYAQRKSGEENADMLNWYIAEIDRLKAKIDSLSAPGRDGVTVFEWSQGEAEVQEDAVFRGGSGDKLP